MVLCPQSCSGFRPSSRLLIAPLRPAGRLLHQPELVAGLLPYRSIRVLKGGFAIVQPREGVNMKREFLGSSLLVLGHRDIVPQPDPGYVWQLETGALALSRIQSNGDSELMCLALAGDLLGVERMAGVSGEIEARAITPVALKRVSVAPGDVGKLVIQALARAQQRCSEMVAVRSGSVPDRVRRLLLLLAERSSPDGALRTNALPSLRDMAIIVGSAHETVSRVLGSLKSLDLLQDRKAQSGTLKVQGLRDCSFLPGMTSSSAAARFRSAAH